MKPTTPQAMTQAASMKPPYGESAKRPPAGPPAAAICSATSVPMSAPRTRTNLDMRPRSVAYEPLATAGRPSGDPLSCRSVGVRHDGPRETEAGRFSQAAFEPDDRPQLAQQSHLATDHRRRIEGAVPMRRGQREGERQVERRFRHGEAAGEAGVEILTTDRDPRSPAEHGDEECQTVGVAAAHRTPR